MQNGTPVFFKLLNGHLLQFMPRLLSKSSRREVKPRPLSCVFTIHHLQHITDECQFVPEVLNIHVLQRLGVKRSRVLVAVAHRFGHVEQSIPVDVSQFK